MKVRLSHDEVIEACAKYAEKKMDFKPTEESIIYSGYFIISNEGDVKANYETVEFEFEFEA